MVSPWQGCRQDGTGVQTRDAHVLSIGVPECTPVPRSARLCLEKAWEITGQCRVRKAQNNPETGLGLSLPGEGRQLRDLQSGLRVARGHLCWGLLHPGPCHMPHTPI